MTELVLVILALLVITSVISVGLLARPSETEQQRIARETREAEREISNIAHKAQTAILSEAIRRAQEKQTRADDSADPIVVDGEVLDVTTDGRPSGWSQ